MSFADDSPSSLPPESRDAVDPLADPASSVPAEEAVEDKKGRKRKKKKEKKKVREQRSDELAATEEGTERRRRFSLADLNVYTVMLMIAFGFLLVGCILMWLELGRYGFDFRAQG